ncbi:MAG: hypothetical protein ACFFCZ_07905 [Promethearchaeota archaeon]
MTKRRRVFVALKKIHLKRSYDPGNSAGEIYLLIMGVKWPMRGYWSMKANQKLELKDPIIVWEGLEDYENQAIFIDVKLKEHDRFLPDKSIISKQTYYSIGKGTKDQRAPFDFVDAHGSLLRLYIWDEKTQH